MRLASPFAVCLALALVPGTLHAQSAADKATARQLAVDGIQLFKSGKYSDALDRLERAQQLYDAHVHLLYIARTQAQLGHLVEALEAYRALVRKPLPADASEVVRGAKNDGETELEALEPRVPSLKLEIEPKSARGFELSINDQPVSEAAVGVDRPVNPGELVVKVRGDGWKPAEQRLTIAEAEKKSVKLTLERDPNATAPKPAATGETLPPPSAEKKPSTVDLSFGLRLSALVPMGSLELKSDDAALLGIETKNLSDLVTAGGGLELRAGLRLFRSISGSVFVEGLGLNPKPSSEDRSQFDEMGLALQSNQGEAESLPYGSRAGLAVEYGKRSDSVGWFAEGAILYEALSSDTEVKQVNGDSCTAEIRFAGGGVRALGGAIFPVGRVLELKPFGGFTLASYSTGEIRGDCGPTVDLEPEGVSGWVSLGIGGDFYFPLP
jgi:tetratricopeptide (TPR) repeat protein